MFQYEDAAAQAAHREGKAYNAFKSEVPSLWASPLKLSKLAKL
jgi:quinol monooxygenase YgiN